MTSPERVNALLDAVSYVSSKGVEGAFVECGVWKGGSSMAMAHKLMDLACPPRDLYLYDTYSGMTAPTEVDVSFQGEAARERFLKTRTGENASDWCWSPLDEVKHNLHSTGYSRDHIHFIEGKVEETIPAVMPGKIALLRLDTDWYASTRHELTHLFPLLQPDGVLIIDDYGHWNGVRKAVDEYLSANNLHLLLHRIDYTGRIAIRH